MDKLKAMKIFVAVAEQGSMAAAARSLGVVNSVISKNLKDLENWLGKKLVFRSTRHLRLTSDGLELLPECQDILDRCQHLEKAALEPVDALKGKIRITAPLYLGQHILMPMLAEFLKTNPGVHLEIALEDKFQNLTEQGFDIAFRVSRLPDSSFLARKLGGVKIKLVASPAYINIHGLPQSPAELKTHTCIMEAEADNRQRWRLKNGQGSTLGLSPSGNCQVNNGNAIKICCLSGLGIAQLPDFFVDEEIATGRLIELLPECALDDLYIHLLYHKRPTKNDAVRALIDYVCDEWDGVPKRFKQNSGSG